MRLIILLMSVLLAGCTMPPVRRAAEAPAKTRAGSAGVADGGTWQPRRRWLPPASAGGQSAEGGARDNAEFRSPVVGTSLSGRRIVVDAGHGGRDPGAIGVTGLQEKDFNLDMAMRLADELLAMGADVIVTRKDDRFLELNLRARIADYEACDLFVSIHADSAKNESARGPTVYIAEGASPISRRVGRAIDRSWRDQGLRTRGVREAAFRVLVGHGRPAVLLECGYLSNLQDEALLKEDTHRDMLARRIARGLVAGL